MESMIDNSDILPLNFRTYVISKVYHSILEYFAHWGPVYPDEFERSYQDLITDTLEREDRFSFVMLMSEFLSKLNNGHTWFSDNWVMRTYNQALPIEIGHVSGKWVVLRSAVDGISNGSVVENINNLPFEEFFLSKRSRISASSEREARSRFPSAFYLFPREGVYDIDMRQHTLEREKSSYFVSKPLEGYWLERDRTALITIRQFSKSIEEDAIGFVKEFFNAERMIIDVRGNKGGTTPVGLVRHLIDGPFGFWKESTPANFGLFKFYGEFVRNNKNILTESMLERLSMAEIFSSTELTWQPEMIMPQDSTFNGELYIITDRYCRSAGEDFILPFKESGRATIIGEPTMGTTGQPFNFNFDNGMQLFVGTKKALFPDGRRFEGVGINPDVSVKTTIEDIKDGRDPQMEYCLNQV